MEKLWTSDLGIWVCSHMDMRVMKRGVWLQVTCGSAQLKHYLYPPGRMSRAARGLCPARSAASLLHCANARPTSESGRYPPPLACRFVSFTAEPRHDVTTLGGNVWFVCTLIYSRWVLRYENVLKFGAHLIRFHDISWIKKSLQHELYSNWQ